ncbi:MAG: hypothetical protein LYZ69_07340 [Nitrososphaerales archaeon]|nr:hypothetical protein [Nitrososphaerales archaeon]
MKAYRVEYEDKIRRAVLGHYSNGTLACVCCGESEIDFLTLDHVNNDGGKVRRQLFGRPNTGGVPYYRWVLKNGFPSNLQTLCYNCNCSKGKHGECVHKHKGPLADEGAMTLDRWAELSQEPGRAREPAPSI